MSTQEPKPAFASISQRAAYFFVRSLAEFAFVLPEGDHAGAPEEIEASQRDLHAFFGALYDALYETPERFGLPVGADDCIVHEHKEGTERKSALNRKLKAPRERIAQGLAFLLMAGQKGKLEGRDLVLPAAELAAFLEKGPRVKRAFLNGLAGAGLAVREEDGKVVLGSDRFPAMMPALKSLAEACARQPDASLGRFAFARCDFGVLAPEAGGSYYPDALTLYRVFGADALAGLSELHAFFTGLGYTANPRIHGTFAWEVQYQGRRQVKSTPLFQVEYQERFRDPLKLRVKCASSNRLAPLLAAQPEALQRDFLHRTHRCGAPRCTWCSTRKNLGPSVIEFQGERKTVCWYVNPDMPGLTAETAELIRQYARMHEQLA